MMKQDEKGVYYTKELFVTETPEPGKNPEPWGKTAVIGKSKSRVDAYERVSGTAVYPSDLSLPNMLYGAILRSPHPHAKIKKVDVSKAIKMPGILDIIASTTPEADIYWPYSKDVKTKLFDPHCRFEGETVAAVAAETPYQAWDALRSIRVDYQILPFIVDEQKAIEPGAPRMHEGGNLVKPKEIYSRGDIEKGFAQADVVMEESYRTECEIHTPMEPHGCVAYWDGDLLVIHESTQGVYSVQSNVAQVLDLPLSKVRVIGHYMGGGFGSKLVAGKYTVIAALLAKRTGRPVKLFLTREETYLCTGNRPPANMTLKAGVKKDGTLTALDFSVTGTGGAYPAGGTALVDWLIKDLYTCPNVRTNATDVYTNAGPARPFRAPGHPQCSWALEQMMDAMAEAIHMDPVQLRLKNIPSYSQAREGNPPYTTTGLKDCLEQGARTFRWDERHKNIEKSDMTKHLKRGVGMASCLWIAGGGGPPSTIILKLFSDGSVNLNMGASDIGTGTKTVMAMVVAEELNVKAEMIQIEHADTGTTQYATPSGGSKTVPTEAPAVRSAAIHIKQQLLQMAADDLKTEISSLHFDGNEIVSENDDSKKIKIIEISGLKKRGVVVGIGYRGPNPEGKAVNPFAAQFCEVEVNTKTGEVKIIDFLGANESGRIIDRLTYDNQVYGGITMGIGFAMTEVRILDGNDTGKMVNRNWHDYKLPTALDVPLHMESLPIDMPDAEANITGAKGLGEPVTIPTAAAIANAVYHATGVRIKQTPLNPLRLSMIFSEHLKEK
ncbi:MAG: xanthine dehydrogenase family protein molybdopterin-binding subunit [Desulfobacterales bacterium]